MGVVWGESVRQREARGRGRGCAEDRRQRRQWLWKVSGGVCFHCGSALTFSTMETDRYPLCGHAGGTYRRDNIVASCATCNRERCAAHWTAAPEKPSESYEWDEERPPF